MPLPISRSALDKLGKRLASNEATETDWETYQRVVGCYQDALDEANRRLRAMDFDPTGRTKSTGTLIDKLARGTSFKSLQDVAGTRIVCPSRNDQDDISHQILTEFAEADRPLRCIDRRIDPMYGYRAVHVVVIVDSLPVEVQIRTVLQHGWAEVTERLGDKWGRSLRYQEHFDGYDIPISEQDTRGSFIEFWREVAQAIATLEDLERRASGESSPKVEEAKLGFLGVLDHAKSVVTDF